MPTRSCSQIQLELSHINEGNVSPGAAQPASITSSISSISLRATSIWQAWRRKAASAASPRFPAPQSGPGASRKRRADGIHGRFHRQSNSLGQQAVNIVGAGETQAIAALIADLKASKSSSRISTQPGGNALLDATGALGAEVAAMSRARPATPSWSRRLRTSCTATRRGRRRQRLRHRKPLQYRWPDGHRSPGDGAAGRNAGHRRCTGTGSCTDAAALAIGDVPVTIVTAEATIVVDDHGNSGTPELAHHLHHTWG